jgi:AbrB family looped-hinge helix DNA binding protein
MVNTMNNAIADTMTDAMITMDGSGRLVIPKEIRRLLHLSSGSVLRFALVGNRLELTPVEPPGPKLRRKSGLMVVPRTGQTFDAVAAIAATRESRP